MRILLSALLSLLILPLQAALPEFALKGHADVGPTFLRIEVLENEEVMDRIDMYGVRSDGTFLFFKDSGFAVKPTITYATGDGDILGYGVGLGYYIPFCSDRCYLVPVVGLGWTHLKTDINLDVATGYPPPYPPIVTLKDVDEQFRSNSRYVGFELMCQVCEPFWATFIYQYAWASSKTYLTHPDLPDGRQVLRSRTSGSNFALSLDYYFKNNISVGLAGGVNTSLDEGRSGIRGYGVKFSIGYCL